MAATLAAALPGACGTEVAPDEVRQEQNIPACAEVCENILAAGCEAPDEADCMADCEPREAIALESEDEACIEAWSDWTHCAAAKSFTCDGFDVSVLPCREARDRAHNRCELGLGPEEPCLDNPVYQKLCPDEKPNARTCRGEKEAGCVIGGSDNHTDLFCCP